MRTRPLSPADPDLALGAPSVTIPTAFLEEGVSPTETLEPTSHRYTERVLLGEGGMGKVVLCHDERIGRDVAMKVILPQLEAEGSARARFLREASVQGQLEHPNIVPVHDIGVSPEGATFFTMKRVRGHTLEEIIEGLTLGDASFGDRFTLRRLLTAFVSICLAVDFAHARGVIHRDLKPANVMLGDFGEVYVLDWGIARLARDVERSSVSFVRDHEVAAHSPVPQTAAGAIVGTVHYMAPEQFTGEPASVASDVFALGAVLFELLTGQSLRGESSTFAAVARGGHDARCSVRAPDRDIAPELEAICVRATTGKPAERYPTARALSEALEHFLEGDRDVIRRRELAAAHVKTARTAIESTRDADDESASSRAMRELGSALALDPDNAEARALVIEALTTTLRTPPRDVAEAIEQRDVQARVSGARRFSLIFGSWLAFAPLLYWAGVRDQVTMATALFLAAFSAAVALSTKARPSIDWLEYIVMGAMVAAMTVVGRFFGPFIIAPTLLATFAVGMQVHPRRRSRRVALVLAIAALVTSVLLEYSGLVPRMLEVGPQGIVAHVSSEVREVPTTLVILLGNIGATISTALLVASVRAQLTRAEERLLVHAWQVRAMMPTPVAPRSRRLAPSGGET